MGRTWFVVVFGVLAWGGGMSLVFVGVAFEKKPHHPDPSNLCSLLSYQLSVGLYLESRCGINYSRYTKKHALPRANR
jgi:hypothetical protein